MNTSTKKHFLSILGTFELIILLVLCSWSGSPLTTKKISNMIEKKSNKQVSLASLYVTLSRLKKKGYIETVGMTDKRGIKGGRARNTYQITELGINAVKESYCDTILPIATDLPKPIFHACLA